MNIKSRKITTYFNQYISECEYSKKLRPKTIRGYKDVFYSFLNQMPEVKDIDDLKPYMLSEFYKRLAKKNEIKEGELKISTIRTYYNKLMSFFRWLENYGYIEQGKLSMKVVKPPNPTYEEEKALKPKDISQVLAAITLHGIQDPFMYQRDMCIILILMYTGVRKGELLGLRVHDIDFSNNSLFVNGKTSKSKKSRNIPMHYSLATQLKNYLKYRKERGHCTDALIVSTKNDSGFTEHGLKHWVEKYKSLSGIDFHIHRFRHSFACELAKKGADIISIMKALGHSSTKMTERYLRSISPEDSRNYINKLSY